MKIIFLTLIFISFSTICMACPKGWEYWPEHALHDGRIIISDPKTDLYERCVKPMKKRGEFEVQWFKINRKSKK